MKCWFLWGIEECGGKTEARSSFVRARPRHFSRRQIDGPQVNRVHSYSGGLPKSSVQYEDIRDICQQSELKGGDRLPCIPLKADNTEPWHECIQDSCPQSIKFQLILPIFPFERDFYLFILFNFKYKYNKTVTRQYFIVATDHLFHSGVYWYPQFYTLKFGITRLGHQLPYRGECAPLQNL